LPATEEIVQVANSNPQAIKQFNMINYPNKSVLIGLKGRKDITEGEAL